MDGGLNAVVHTERGEGELVKALAASGVQVSPLSEYWSGPGNPSGIVFGFGGVSEDELSRALRIIAREAALSAR
jgi:GntR family transcriptional regulator/MocR family aminotransferase